MKLPSRNQVRQLRRDNLRWPRKLAEVPRDQWLPSDFDSAVKDTRTRVWRSREFLVQEFQATGGAIRLSVCRTDWDGKAQRWKEDITWDELQRLKNEAGYGGSDAVEVYPADRDIVNVANMRHLFIPADPLPFVWRRRR